MNNDKVLDGIEKDIKLSNEQYGSILLQKNLKNNNFNTFTANKNAKTKENGIEVNNSTGDKM